jgi:hypothetical protein
LSSAVARRAATSVLRWLSACTRAHASAAWAHRRWPLVHLGELHAAAEELRLLVEEPRHRLDRRVRRARRLLRLREQHGSFRVLRLFEDDAAEERDGVARPILIEIEARQREIDGEIAAPSPRAISSAAVARFGYCDTSSPGFNGCR